MTEVNEEEGILPIEPGATWEKEEILWEEEGRKPGEGFSEVESDRGG